MIYLYKNFLKINLLLYGLNYDINILISNKYILSFLDLDILNKKYLSINNIIKNIDKN